ncbi:alpha/beta hydrolase [Actinoplanes sp. NPDC026619]|uniref:alpha/beta hydrolase n=1 Tax=Actinoplanes sp. NPDC026619 TaxID=3155798 RepID=UPI0033DE08AE
MTVTLTTPRPVPYRIAGWLCQPRHQTTTVQVLVSGLTYTHRYWTGPGPNNNQVAAALAAGDAVYLFDRLGTGDSDRPPAAQVTTTSEAAATHQILHALRNGTLGHYPRVIGVGHSFGTVIWMAEAATYRDVDALVLTGLLHDINLDAMTRFTTDLYPAGQDPQFAASAPPDGYLTTRPGSRADYFLNPDTSPDVAAWDESTKTTATTGELTFTPEDELRYSRAIQIPVLLVLGATDALFCGAAQPCATPADICQRERPAFPHSADLTAAILPATGHSINLHPTAPLAFALMNRWLADLDNGPDHRPQFADCRR